MLLPPYQQRALLIVSSQFTMESQPASEDDLAVGVWYARATLPHIKAYVHKLQDKRNELNTRLQEATTRDKEQKKKEKELADREQKLREQEDAMAARQATMKKMEDDLARALEKVQIDKDDAAWEKKGARAREQYLERKVKELKEDEEALQLKADGMEYLAEKKKASVIGSVLGWVTGAAAKEKASTKSASVGKEAKGGDEDGFELV